MTLTKGELTEAQKTVESLNKAVINKLKISFTSVHALCLAGRPFSDYDSSCHMEPELYCNGFSTDGPSLSKGKQSLGLISNDDFIGQKRGDSFPLARKKMIDELKKSLQSRFECECVIQAMSICNFRSWPGSNEDNKTEIAGLKHVIFQS